MCVESREDCSETLASCCLECDVSMSMTDDELDGYGSYVIGGVCSVVDSSL